METEPGSAATTGSVSRRRFLQAAGFTATAALAGCLDGGSSDGLSGEIKIAGSSTVYPISNAVSEEFATQYPDVTVSVSSTGTGGGFSNFFCPGKTDINDASRPIKESERQSCSENDVTPMEFPVATDALTVIVNKEADWIDCVTVDELAQIWGPNGATKWSDVNPDWPDEEFEFYGPTSASGTFDYFTETVIGEGGSHRKEYQATEQDNTIVNGVKGSKYAMGYFGFAYYSQNKETVKAVSIDNGDGCISPSLDNAKAGTYRPLSRPLFIYLKKEALGREAVREFARFYLEQTDSELISQIGYVPLAESTAQENLDALEAAIEEVA